MELSIAEGHNLLLQGWGMGGIGPVPRIPKQHPWLDLSGLPESPFFLVIYPIWEAPQHMEEGSLRSGDGVRVHISITRGVYYHMTSIYSVSLAPPSLLILAKASSPPLHASHPERASVPLWA